MKNLMRDRRPAIVWQRGLWILWICFSAGILPVWGQAAAPPKEQAKLTAKTKWSAENITFEQVLQRLHKQHGLNLFVSGIPLRATANLFVSGTVADALDAFALAFDYQWAMDNQGVVLLTKAFYNQEDFPQMNLAEVRHTLKTLLNAVENAPPDPEMPDTEKKKLIQSLTPPQWDLLRAGQALTGQLLTEAQRRQCQQIALWSLSRNKYLLNRSFELHDQLEQSEICVTDVKRRFGTSLEEVTVTELQFFLPKSPTVPFFSLGSNVQLQIFPVPMPLPRIQDPLFFSEVRGKIHPEGAAKRWNQNVSFSENRITLGKLLPRMSMPGQLTFRAKDAQKPFVLHIHCANVSRLTLTKAIAELEDWHWSESQTGTVEFMSRSLREIGNIPAIARRIQSAQPRELRDYLGTRRPPLSPVPLVHIRFDQQEVNKITRISHRSYLLSSTALQQLIAAFSTPERKDKHFAVSKLSDANRQRIAWIFSDMRSFDGYWLRDLPPFLSNPQTLQIKKMDKGLRVSAKYTEPPNAEEGFDIEFKELTPPLSP